ncbi:hypothetical protein P7K49_003251 [Saguinus oedipus]|uniref:Uncharacterized protein n=1 Tax=Saguinus oedipus TaxID=9490 RepID=A0ABQ9WJN0_SAGOE|nr:hypothetical protein P7K49_003251 [Saguinus oedipus]
MQQVAVAGSFEAWNETQRAQADLSSQARLTGSLPGPQQPGSKVEPFPRPAQSKEQSVLRGAESLDSVHFMALAWPSYLGSRCHLGFGSSHGLQVRGRLLDLGQGQPWVGLCPAEDPALVEDIPACRSAGSHSSQPRADHIGGSKSVLRQICLGQSLLHIGEKAVSQTGQLP